MFGQPAQTSRRESPLMQGRGLEHYKLYCLISSRMSPLMQGRGLELSTFTGAAGEILSPLMQGRGLELVPRDIGACPQGRRPSCRGVDWNTYNIATGQAFLVAPHAGAWIGTRAFLPKVVRLKSPLMQGRGLERRHPQGGPLGRESPLMQGRGLELVILCRAFRIRAGRPSCRGVDWNSPWRLRMRKACRRPSCRGVDWNKVQWDNLMTALGVAPHAGAWIGTSVDCR